MQNEMDALDIFGQFLMKHVRDSAIGFGLNLLQGQEKAVSLQRIQKTLAAFSPEQQSIMKEFLIQCIDHAIHDFLFALTMNADTHTYDEEETEEKQEISTRGRIQILVDGEDVTDLTDNLHWGPGEEWIAKYSKFTTLE